MMRFSRFDAGCSAVTTGAAEQMTEKKGDCSFGARDVNVKYSQRIDAPGNFRPSMEDKWASRLSDISVSKRKVLPLVSQQVEKTRVTVGDSENFLPDTASKSREIFSKVTDERPAVSSVQKVTQNQKSETGDPVDRSGIKRREIFSGLNVRASLKAIKNVSSVFGKKFESGVRIISDQVSGHNKDFLRQNELNQKCYSSCVEEIGQSFVKALKNYIVDNPQKHRPILLGYTNWKELSGLKINDKDIVSFDIPHDHQKFIRQLCVITRKHHFQGSLCKNISDKLESFGFNLNTDILNEVVGVSYDGVRMFEDRSKKTTAADESVAVKVESDDVRRPKKMDRSRLNKQLAEQHARYNNLILRTKLVKAILYCQNLFDKHHPVEVEPLENYNIYYDNYFSKHDPFGVKPPESCSIGAEYMPLEFMTTEAMEQMLEKLKLANGEMEGFIVRHILRLPVKDGAEPPLLTIAEGLTVEGVANDALNFLHQPPFGRDKFRQVLLHSTCREEFFFRKRVMAGLNQFMAICSAFKKTTEIKIPGLAGWQSCMDAPWFSNLLAHFLIQSLPEPLKTVGPVKVSSSFRKAWKEKLAQWGIERAALSASAAVEQSSVSTV